MLKQHIGNAKILILIPGFLFAISLLLGSPLFAVTWEMTKNVNSDYEVNNQTSIVSIGVNTSRLLDSKNRYSSDCAVRFLKSPDGGDATVCTFKPNVTSSPISYEVNCGLRLVPLRIHQENDGPMVMDFILKNKKGKYSEILTRPDSSETVWLKEDLNAGVSVSEVPLARWLISEEYITSIKSDPLDHPIFFEPKDGSTVSTTCTQQHFGYSKKVQGDWINVYCELPSCFSPIGFACEAEEEAERKEQKKTKPVCKSGWIRWIGPDRHLMLQPEIGPGCD